MLTSMQGTLPCVIFPLHLLTLIPFPLHWATRGGLGVTYSGAFPLNILKLHLACKVDKHKHRPKKNKTPMPSHKSLSSDSHQKMQSWPQERNSIGASLSSSVPDAGKRNSELVRAIYNRDTLPFPHAPMPLLQAQPKECGSPLAWESLTIRFSSHYGLSHPPPSKNLYLEMPRIAPGINGMLSMFFNFKKNTAGQQLWKKNLLKDLKNSYALSNI